MHFPTDLGHAGGELVQNKGTDETLLIEHILRLKKGCFLCVYWTKNLSLRDLRQVLEQLYSCSVLFWSNLHVIFSQFGHFPVHNNTLASLSNNSNHPVLRLAHASTKTC